MVANQETNACHVSRGPLFSDPEALWPVNSVVSSNFHFQINFKILTLFTDCYSILCMKNLLYMKSISRFGQSTKSDNKTKTKIFKKLKL